MTTTSNVLESMDRAGSAARREADEEVEIRAALRTEVARAGSQDKLAAEWGLSQHHLSRVLAGLRRPGPTVRDRLGVARHKADRHASPKLDKLHVPKRPPTRSARHGGRWRLSTDGLIAAVRGTRKGIFSGDCRRPKWEDWP
jgi:hypothetical protein